MIKIAVVEDCVESQKRIKNYIEKYAKEENEQIETELFSDGIHIVEDYHNQYDIIFCDIQMKIMDGLETARKIREKDQKTVIIFITNLAEYAIKGYEVEAIGYLLKPLNYITFEMYMRRAVNLVRSGKEEYLVLEFKGGIRRYLLDEIYYFEYEKHYIWIHQKTGNEKILFSMKELEEKLKGKAFSRCNSGNIVNLRYVQELKNNVVNVNGELLTVSRARKKQFINELTEYLGGDYDN